MKKELINEIVEIEEVNVNATVESVDNQSDAEKPKKPKKTKKEIEIDEFLTTYYANKASRLEAAIINICFRVGISVPSDLTEYISVAGEAITQAITKYDPDKGASFSTFATGIIQKKILNYITTQNTIKRGRDVVITYNTDLNDTYEHKDDIPEGYIQVADPASVEDVVFKDAVSDNCDAYLTGLTKVQRQIAEMLMAGDTPAEIRAELGLTTKRWESIWASMTKFDRKKVFFKKY